MEDGMVPLSGPLSDVELEKSLKIHISPFFNASFLPILHGQKSRQVADGGGQGPAEAVVMEVPGKNVLFHIL